MVTFQSEQQNTVQTYSVRVILENTVQTYSVRVILENTVQTYSVRVILEVHFSPIRQSELECCLVSSMILKEYSDGKLPVPLKRYQLCFSVLTGKSPFGSVHYLIMTNVYALEVSSAYFCMSTCWQVYVSIMSISMKHDIRIPVSRI